MEINVQIKTIFGKVLFEFKKENNSIKETLIEGIKTGADLRDAYLRGADLTDANLRGANDNKIKIKRAIVFSGLYKYIVIPFISEDGTKYIKMGCYTRKLSEWNKDFWNNPNEFMNDNSEKSNLRLLAFQTAKKWFELIEK
jgi:hypothetical protein